MKTKLSVKTGLQNRHVIRVPQGTQPWSAKSQNLSANMVKDSPPISFTVGDVQKLIVSDEENDEDNEINTLENGTQTGKHMGKRKTIILEPSNSISGKEFGKKEIKKVQLMDWKSYHRLKVIYSFLDDLERDYPAICTVCVIGQTVEGRDIKMLKISNSDASNSAVWLDGGIHSREWITSAVVTYIANILVKNFTEHDPCITKRDWYIVPVLNPDGYEYTHTGDRMWRKNKARLDGSIVGVDLNRNFSYGWGNNGEEGSSDDPEHAFYRGPSPFSEPESIAVRDVILKSNAKFEVFLSYHSYFESIIFPWGYKREPCPHYIQLLEAGTIMARAIYDTYGFIYKVGSTKDLTYFACGTSTDWAYANAKIPYSFMIELRSRRYRFRLPKTQIMETCVENWNALVCLMQYVELNPVKLDMM